MEYQISSKNRVNLVDAIPLDFPLTIDFELTNKCNFKCVFCPIGAENYEDKVGYDKVSIGLVEKIINEVNERGTKLKVFRFSMFGEALLHPNFGEILSLIKEASIAEKIEITTNASVMGRRKIDALLSNPPDAIRISIYGLNENEYFRNTGKRGMFEKCMNNIQLLSELKKKSASDLPLVYIKSFETNPERKKLFSDLFINYADQIGYEDGHTWDGRVNATIPPNSSFSTVEKKICPLPFYKVIINSSGDFTFCCVDWQRKTSVGNLKRNSIYELFNGTESLNFRKAIISGDGLPEPCTSCTFFKNPFYVKDNIDDLSLASYEKKVAAMQGQSCKTSTKAAKDNQT